MCWVNVVEAEIPRLRVYAAALAGSVAAGDAAVTAVIDALTGQPPDVSDRALLFAALDVRLRDGAPFAVSERIELLRTFCGFDAATAAVIAAWEGRDGSRSAG